MTNIAERAAAYGVVETNNIADAAYNHEAVDYSSPVSLDDPRIISVDRVRFLSDPGFPYWDLSYARATICDWVDGKIGVRHVPLRLSVTQLPRKDFWTAFRAAVVADGLPMDQAERLGTFNNNVVSFCC